MDSADEIPADRVLHRTAGPFTTDSMPPGLRKVHATADGYWGRLRVLAGSIDFSFVDYPAVLTLQAGDSVVLPPGRAHLVQPDPTAEFAVDFFGPPNT